MSEFIDIIHKSERCDTASIVGYNEREISHIAALYEINVTGQLFELLLQIGRCAGKVIGDDQLIIYSSKTVRGHFTYQNMRRENAGYKYYKSFYLGFRQGKDILLRASDSVDDTVYTYNREKRTMESTGKTLLDTVSEIVLDKNVRDNVFFRQNEPVSFQGELIKLD